MTHCNLDNQLEAIVAPLSDIDHRVVVRVRDTARKGFRDAVTRLQTNRAAWVYFDHVENYEAR